MVSFFSEDEEIGLEIARNIICESSWGYLNDLLNDLKQYFGEAYEHSKYTALWASAIAKVSNMSQEDVTRIYLCGLLHDLGKLKIPQRILTKAGTLTKEEYEDIMEHALEGYMLIKEHVAEDIATAVLMHHERLDGSGYPSHLKGNMINEYAKILMIADSFDAMIVHRVYHKKRTYSEALLELRSLKDKYEIKYIDALEQVIIAKKVSLS